jgi:methylisocitrate lyase
MAISAGTRLRQLLKSGRAVQFPGAFNGISARIAADTGFEGLYVSGGAISAASGVPDIGLCSLDYFCDRIREVTSVSGLPVIADADTGFGEAEMVTRTVREYIHAGAGGLHIEDQSFPKRCGHLDGKELVSIEHMSEKISRGKDAVGDSGFIICARTDARGVEGFDQAVARAKAYVRAGADMIFPEGLKDLDEFRKFSVEMNKMGDLGLSNRGGPFLLANMTEFGKTDHIHINDFDSAGYSAVIYPVSTLRVAMKAVESMLQELKSAGMLKNQEKHMLTRKDLYKALHYTPGVEWHYPSQSRK